MPNHPLEQLSIPVFLYGEPPTAPERSARPLVGYDFHYDAYDQRSKSKCSGQIVVALPPVDIGADSEWPPEMILPLDRALLHPLPAGLQLDAPSQPIDHEILKHLKDTAIRSVLRHHRIRLYHNSASGFYSQPGESREEFKARCEYQLRQESKGELDQLRLKFERKLEGLTQRTSRQMPSVGEEDPLSEKLLSAHRQMINNTRDALARMFLNTELRAGYKPLFTPLPGNEVEEDFESFHHQAWVEVQHVAGRIDFRTNQIEDYQFPLRYGDLVLDQLFALWKAA
jgi:hypothetical protein